MGISRIMMIVNNNNIKQDKKYKINGSIGVTIENI